MWWLVAWGLLSVAACVSAILPVGTGHLHERVGDAFTRQWQRLRPPPPSPAGRPIEDLAASLRRLQRWLDSYAESQPMPGKATKVTAASMAYDRVLADACHALDLPEALDGTEGLDREAERLRMQAALADAGFVLAGRRSAGR